MPDVQLARGKKYARTGGKGQEWNQLGSVIYDVPYMQRLKKRGVLGELATPNVPATSAALWEVAKRV